MISHDFFGNDTCVLIADTWNFVFEKTPSADNCIVGPDYLEKDYF